jgi:hypothetical protein
MNSARGNLLSLKLRRAIPSSPAPRRRFEAIPTIGRGVDASSPISTGIWLS